MPRSVRIDRFQPTWHQGFARSASESAYPGLWKGLMGGYSSGLGPTGQVIHDISHYHGDGDLTSGMVWLPNDGRQALNFSGSVQNVTIPAANSVALEVTGVTVSAWIYLRALVGSGQTEGAVFEKTIAGAINTSYLLFIDARVLLGRAIVGGDVAGADAVDPTNFLGNVWKHVAYTYNEGNGDFALYVDGAVVDSGSRAAGAIDTGSGIATIGVLSAVPSRFIMDGFIDDMFIHNRPLRSHEILKLWTIKRGGIFQRRPMVLAKAPAVAAGGLPERSYPRGVNRGVLRGAI